MRCGGSKLRLGDGHPLEAVSWYDEYNTAISQMWIDASRRSSFSHCQLPVSVLSDSARAIAEVEHAAADRIMISHCCSQPLHRDKTTRRDFFLQEVIDLFIMARSKRIIATVGPFAILGQAWLGKSGPLLTSATTREDISVVMIELLEESGSRDINVAM